MWRRGGIFMIRRTTNQPSTYQKILIPPIVVLTNKRGINACHRNSDLPDYSLILMEHDSSKSLSFQKLQSAK